MGRIPINKERVSNDTKRREIAEALFPHFMRLGIKAISTNQMCDFSHKSKATLYKYFESKEEIINYIVAVKLELIAKFPQVLTDQSISFKERYIQAVSLTIQSIEGITPIFLGDLSDTFPSISENILLVKKAAMELLKNFYQEGIEAGVFINISPDAMVLNDELFFTAILESNFLDDKETDLKKLFEDYFKVRFHGILV